MVVSVLMEGLFLFVSLVDAIPSLVWLTLGTAVVLSFLIYAVLVPPKPSSRALTQPDQFFLATQYFPEDRLSDDSDFHLLLICNPLSGNAQGLRLCELIVQPMLRVANIRYELIVTESGSHAFELAADIDPEEYSGIAAIGGDSILHELVNGLFHASDCDSIKFDMLLARLPIGIIPTGGGNDGLANSLGLSNAYIATKRMIEAITNDNYRHLDLYSVERVLNPTNTLTVPIEMMPSCGIGLYDFHISTWGLLADVELSTMRNFSILPKACRWYLALARALLNHQPKKGSLVMKVHGPILPELVGKGLPEMEAKSVSISGGFAMVAISNVSHWRKDAIIDPDARPDDGRLSVIVVRHCSRWNFLRTLVAMETGSHVDLPWVTMYRCSEVVLFNETGEANISGYGEAELDPKINKTDGLRFRSNTIQANIMC
jgi:diacylglycerol kinase (ATP)